MPLSPPTFAGAPIFGIALEMKPCQINPVAHQQTDYPGLDGVEEVRLGERGAWTTCRGLMWGPTPEAFAVMVQGMRGARNWGKQTLVDQFGQVWPLVRLESFELTGRVRWDPGGLGYVQEYQARFFHAVIP